VASMATRSDAALSTLLLTSRIVDVDAPALSAKEYWALTRQVEPLDTLFGLTSSDIASSFDIEPERAERIVSRLSGATQLAFELERLDRQGYFVLTPFDDEYPRRLIERLGDQAPPSITAVGSVGMLSTEGVGLVGSRNATAEAIGVAEAVAASAAGRGSSVVSGGARGIDQRSMAAAYQAGGSVVGWLAESLEKRLRDPETRRVVSDGQVCLATPFKPDAGFSVANAMGRNKLIYASARVTLVVACDPGKGGTWEGAVESIRKSYGSVAVWAGAGAGPGNEALLAQGGAPVASVEELFDAQPLSVKRQRPQLSLEL
jgi:predicted Rossmann fold nucleotide-binding protein DprA/Smf involved in DNA uptake